MKSVFVWNSLEDKIYTASAHKKSCENALLCSTLVHMVTLL